MFFIVYDLNLSNSTASTRDGQFQYVIFLAMQMEILARGNLSLGSELLRRNDVNLKLLVTLKNKIRIESS